MTTLTCPLPIGEVISQVIGCEQDTDVAPFAGSNRQVIDNGDNGMGSWTPGMTHHQYSIIDNDMYDASILE